MALKPKFRNEKENDVKKIKENDSDDDDDFVPRKKKQKVLKDIKDKFPGSTLANCTFNINFNQVFSVSIIYY